MTFEILLPLGSEFTLVAEEGRIFAAYIPQVEVQVPLVLVRPMRGSYFVNGGKVTFEMTSTLKAGITLFAQERTFLPTCSSQVVFEVVVAFEDLLAFITLERPL